MDGLYKLDFFFLHNRYQIINVISPAVKTSINGDMEDFLGRLGGD